MLTENDIQSCEKAVETLIVFLREGKGFKKDLFDHVIHALKSCGDKLIESLTIPKKFAEILVDLHFGISTCASMYDQEEQKRMLEAAAEVQEAVLFCVSRNESK